MNSNNPLERDLRVAVEQSANIVIITDREGNIEYVNPKFTEITGYSSEEVLGKNPRLLKSGQMSKEYYQNLWNTLLSGNEWRGDIINRKKDGEPYWASANISPVRDAEGNIFRFIAIQEDVTARKTAENLLRISERKFSQLVTYSPDPIVVLDRFGGILSVNPAAEREWGYSKSELEGNDFIRMGIVSLPSVPKVTQELAETSSGQTRKPFELEMISKEGGKITFDANLSLMPGHGEGEKIQMIFRNMSEKKNLEKLQEEFVNTVSHEFRTPLTIIKGSVENLRDGVAGKLTEKQEKIVQTTARNIDRLARLINSVLDLSRLESRRSKVNRVRLDLAAVLQETVDGFENTSKNKNLRFKTVFPSSLPSVHADPDLIIRMLANLLDNAFRFAKSEVTVKAEAREEKVRISVMDDGAGIAPEDQKELFSKFHQIHRPIGGAGYKGTGLGLAICKEIAEVHQGKIWIESALGRGTAFHFEVPVCGQLIKTTIDDIKN